MSTLGKAQSLVDGAVMVSPLSSPLCGDMHVPADKSIAQRAFLLASMAVGVSHIKARLDGEDLMVTIKACRALGATIVSAVADHYTVTGCDWRLNVPTRVVDCGESATLMRLLLGLSVGRSCDLQLTGRKALLKRPMGRVIEPLQCMGAEVWQCPKQGVIRLKPALLRGRHHALKVPSAQLKSAILLAGLGATCQTSVDDSHGTRDHTERLLAHMGVVVQRKGTHVMVQPQDTLPCFSLGIAGDFSSAAFWMVAACVVPGSKVVLRGIHVNPTRLGLLWVLRQMGAMIDVIPHDAMISHEPVADIVVCAAGLHGITVPLGRVVTMIDELPVLAVAAALASGSTVIRGAAELRIKESDRIVAMAEGLRTLGCKIQVHHDGWVVEGGSLHGGEVDARGDHRVAMAFAIAALVAKAPVMIKQAGSVAKSYRGFFDCLAKYATLRAVSA